MKKEIKATAEFISKIFPRTVDADKRKAFAAQLQSELGRRYDGHWPSENPLRGNAYRALICCHGTVDTAIEKAAKVAGLEGIERMLPMDLIVWCDPGNVSYRMGEHGSIGTVFDASEQPMSPLKSPGVKPSRVVRITSDTRPKAAKNPKHIREKRAAEIAVGAGN